MIVVGMGGSHLAADLLKLLKPELDITVYRDYGLPKSKPNELIVLSSYSGNTEEVLDAYDKASGLNRAVITIGGKLLEKAKQDNVPFVLLPAGLQPRDAIHFCLVALYELLGEKLELPEVKPALPIEIIDRIPLIYTSNKFEALGYIWKIKFNETGKIPAFNDVLPEADHNEINGFAKFNNFYGLFIFDKSDDPRIINRMKVTAKLYNEIGIPTKFIELTGSDTLHKIFNFLALANATALATAKYYGLDPVADPKNEKLKKEL
ncbi:MAG: SIS domain-containing protein [Candidatus Amesbacteria bacterium]|nr:SIS domain-containing protein [Candidatus Amesbacteria bacterium]